jgi:hypothetical protein
MITHFVALYLLVRHQRKADDLDRLSDQADHAKGET